MTKLLRNKENRGQKYLQLYGCACVCSKTCTGCGSSPSYDYLNVQNNSTNTNIDNLASRVVK